MLFREDATVDDLIDVIEGNRKYMKCIYVYNKIDVIGIDDVDKLARQPNSVVISCNLKVSSTIHFAKCEWRVVGKFLFVMALLSTFKCCKAFGQLSIVDNIFSVYCCFLSIKFCSICIIMYYFELFEVHLLIFHVS